MSTLWNFLFAAPEATGAEKWALSLLILALQSSLLVGFAWGALLLLLRHASASLRHWIWTLTFSALCLLPLLPFVSAALPHPWRVASTQISPQVESKAEFRDFERGTFASPSMQASPPASPNSSSIAGSASTSNASPSLSIPHWAMNLGQSYWPLATIGLWLVGVGVCAIRLLAGVRYLHLLKRKSAVLQDEEWRRASQAALGQLGIGRKVSLCIAAGESGSVVPLTWGWVRPVVLLPATAHEWLPAKRQAALLHEMAHIARCDWLILWLAQLVCVLYWFNPLVWWAARGLRAEGERATDDHVLKVGMRPSEYAECLLEFMQVLKGAAGGRSKGLVLTIGMAQASTISERVLALLDGKRSRQAISRIHVFGGGVATLGLLLTIAAFSRADDNEEPADNSPMVTVRGRMLDEAGRPQANAKIGVYESSNWDKEVRTLYSDSKGAYAVEVPDKLQAYRMLQIEKSGFGVKVATVLAEDAKRRCDWTLVKPTSLSGVVTDENERPIAGALVKAVYFMEEGLLVGYAHGIETRTNTRGQWKLDRLPIGVTSEFEVLAPRFARKRFDALLEKVTAPFPAVKLQPGFEATGKVLDVKGQPVAGATISTRYNGQARTTTDKNGAFALPGLTLTDQSLTVDTPLRNQFGPEETRVSPSAPQVQIQLHRGIAIRGRILDVATRAPIEGVQVSDQMHWGNPSLSNAQGQFKVTLHSSENASLTFASPNYQLPQVVFLTPDQLASGEVGDITLKRGTIWRGQLRVKGSNAPLKTTPSERVYFNLHSTVGNAQLATDGNGNFQINSLPPGTYSWDADVWNWRVVVPRQITIPAPGAKPFVLDVQVERVPQVVARGRVVNQQGKPLPYARIQLKGAKRGYLAIARADGSWERAGILASETLSIQKVEYKETALDHLATQGRKTSAGWQFPAVVVDDKASQTQVQVLDANGQKAAGARVLALWGKEMKFALTDAQGLATFNMAPQPVRFLAAKTLNYGEATREVTPTNRAPVRIQLHAPQTASQARTIAKALLTKPGTDLSLIPYASIVLGEQRYRLLALVVDGAARNEAEAEQGKILWNRAGDNFGNYLDELVRLAPKTALTKAPIWLTRITTPETKRPFFLRNAEADFALLAARSHDATAKKWASSWLDRQLASFDAVVALKPIWSNGDRVARYLQGYAVARELHRPETGRFFEAALKALPEETNNPQCYGYPQYFTLQDPNTAIFRAKLVPDNQVGFQGVLGGNEVRADAAKATKARADLENLMSDLSGTDIEKTTRVFAHRLIESEVLRWQIRTETPRQAFEKLKAFDSTDYNIGTFAHALARRALQSGDKVLAREVLNFSQSKGWTESDIDGDWKPLQATLLPREAGAKLEAMRAQAIANLINGDPIHGNISPDIGADSRNLRRGDAALGRLILEAKWRRLLPLKVDRALDKRYEAANLAHAMEAYDLGRALNWFVQIPAGGDFDQTDAKLTLAAKIVGATPSH